jgi:hypothetical protein
MGSEEPFCPSAARFIHSRAAYCYAQSSPRNEPDDDPHQKGSGKRTKRILATNARELGGKRFGLLGCRVCKIGCLRAHLLRQFFRRLCGYLNSIADIVSVQRLR